MKRSQPSSKSPKEEEYIKRTVPLQGSSWTGDTCDEASYFDNESGPLTDLETSFNTFYIEKHPKESGSETISPSKGPRRPRKASFSDALHDLRSFPQRTMRSIIGLCDKESSPAVDSEREHPDQPPSPSWLRRAASTSFGCSRRPSLLKTPITHNSTSQTPVNPTRPGTGVDPSFIPYTVGGGAAARAAAAAQNEITEAKRTSILHQDLRSVESKVPTDSESGIGIEVRDRFDYMDITLPVVRQDPSYCLPVELLTHILSYLDGPSLINSDLVSRRWHRTAGSSHVWKHVFWRDYGLPCFPSPNYMPVVDVGGFGLGKERPDQDWKKMWNIRKVLQSRWSSGSAAAIYLEGHRDSVYCVQFDEHKIVTGSRDRTVRVWDTHTYKCIKVLGVPKRGHIHLDEPLVNLTNRGRKPTISIIAPRHEEPLFVADASIHHKGSILCLQFDKDIMVTGSSDHTLIVWNIHEDYRPVRRLRHHTAGVLDVCFDTKHIISCSKDSSLCLWDRQTGDLLRILRGHRGPVNAVQLRGSLVVSASGDGFAKLWNLESGLCIKEFPSKDRGLACVEFSPDSSTILAGGNDQVIYHFDANTGKRIRMLEGHRDLVRSLYLDSANGRIISGSYDTSVKAFDSHTGNLICDFAGWTTSWMLAAKSDYRRIVATSQDSRVVIMDFGHQLPGIELLER